MPQIDVDKLDLSALRKAMSELRDASDEAQQVRDAGVSGLALGRCLLRCATAAHGLESAWNKRGIAKADVFVGSKRLAILELSPVIAELRASGAMDLAAHEGKSPSAALADLLPVLQRCRPRLDWIARALAPPRAENGTEAEQDLSPKASELAGHGLGRNKEAGSRARG